MVALLQTDCSKFPSLLCTSVIRSKVGLKTFCFDREKQSNFFITNSLWEMGDDVTGDENAGRGRKQGAAC